MMKLNTIPSTITKSGRSLKTGSNQYCNEAQHLNMDNTTLKQKNSFESFRLRKKTQPLKPLLILESIWFLWPEIFRNQGTVIQQWYC